MRSGDRVEKRARLFSMRSGAFAELCREVEAEAHEADLAVAVSPAKLASLKVASEGSNRFWVVAPRRGTVVELDASPSKEVTPDRERPLMRISDLDEVLALADVQEADAADIQCGLPVEVPTLGGVTRTGVVDQVAEVVDPTRRTVAVRVRVANTDRALRPNAMAEVVFRPPTEGQRVRIPSEAVITDGPRRVVFVARAGGHLDRTRVTVGRERDGETEILPGLDPGDRYVAKGGLLLSNQIELSEQDSHVRAHRRFLAQASRCGALADRDRGPDLGSFVAEAQRRVKQQVHLRPGMTIEWGGEFESKERAMKRLLTVVPVALLVTLILLFKSFDCLPLAILTLVNVPFALLGGVFGLYLARMPFSVAAAVDLIALIGQASLNGVLVVSAIHERMLHGEPLTAAITHGCRERLRPVLMTALLAALGLVPAALSRALGAETQRPIAVVIVTGTLTACLLTLIVLSAVYALWSRRAPAALALDEAD